MASVRMWHKVHQSTIHYILRSPNGPVAKDMRRRAHRVQRLARSLVQVDTGRLRGSIQVYQRQYAGKPVFRVGSDLYYALWVHDGTGIYGRTGSPIRPSSASHMTFYWKKRGKLMRVRSVRGQRGSKYLKRALVAAAD